jgi:hypothetical protein
VENGVVGKFISGELVGEESLIDSATTELAHMDLELLGQMTSRNSCKREFQ